MSATWNDGARPVICTCSDCNAKSDPPCRIYDRDEIPMREAGLCEKCAKDLEEVEE